MLDAQRLKRLSAQFTSLHCTLNTVRSLLFEISAICTRNNSIVQSDSVVSSIHNSFVQPFMITLIFERCLSAFCNNRLFPTMRFVNARQLSLEELHCFCSDLS